MEISINDLKKFDTHTLKEESRLFGGTLYLIKKNSEENIEVQAIGFEPTIAKLAHSSDLDSLCILDIFERTPTSSVTKDEESEENLVKATHLININFFIERFVKTTFIVSNIDEENSYNQALKTGAAQAARV